jgi:hypothetical protein
MSIISAGKWAPLQLIAIVALPHDGLWGMEEDRTAHGLKEKLATKPGKPYARTLAKSVLSLITRGLVKKTTASGGTIIVRE